MNDNIRAAYINMLEKKYIDDALNHIVWHINFWDSQKEFNIAKLWRSSYSFLSEFKK